MKSQTISNFKGFNFILQQEIISLANEGDKKILTEAIKPVSKYHITGKKNERITGITADEIKSTVNMHDVVRLLGLSVDIRNTMVCPFHNEKTPSLKIYSNARKWKCFGCGVGGDVIKFVELYKGVSFREALYFLGGRDDISIKQHGKIKSIQEQHKKNEQARNSFHIRYLRALGLHRYLIKCRRLYAPTDVDQDSEEWHPLFIYAAQNLRELEYWLDENNGGEEVYKCKKW